MNKLLQVMLSKQEGGAENYFEKLADGFSRHGSKPCEQVFVIEPHEEREALLQRLPNTKTFIIRFGGLREWSGQRHLRRILATERPDAGLTWMNRASRRMTPDYCPVAGRLGGYYSMKHYKACSLLIGITPDLVRHIEANKRVDQNSVLIPNFGDLAPPNVESENRNSDLRQSLDIPEGKTIVLALGRLHEVKAHDILIEAVKGLENVVVLIAGEGPLRNELEQQIRRNGQEGQVQLLGWRRDTANLLELCDISVFPSRYEPNGNVVMESWAAQRPLIAARSAGPSWLIDDGETGLLFDIDATAQLREKIRQLQMDKALCARLVAAGYSKYESEFSRKVIVDRYMKALQTMAAR